MDKQQLNPNDPYVLAFCIRVGDGRVVDYYNVYVEPDEKGQTPLAQAESAYDFLVDHSRSLVSANICRIVKSTDYETD